MKHVFIINFVFGLTAISGSLDDFSESNSGSEDDPKTFYELEDMPLILHGSIRTRLALDYALTDPSNDTVCSPLAALIPAAKLLIGASGESKRQLQDAIGANSPSEVKAHFQPLLKELKSLTGMSVAILNRIYMSSSHERQTLFRDYLKDIFESSVKVEDLTNVTQVSQKINEWVETKTKKAIHNFIDTYDIYTPEGSMMIFNTVYFSAQWQHAFTLTDFHKNPMVTRGGRYKYLVSDDFDCQIIEIPFTENKASFIIFLPKSKSDFTLLLKTLRTNPEKVKTNLNRMTKRYLQLTIPRFDTSTELDLSKEYRQLGLTNIFNKTSSGLTEIIKGNTNLYVTRAVQKMVIKVNELGVGSHYVEMGAPPTLDIAPLSEVESPIYVTAEVPFLYIIKVMKEIVVTGIYNPK